MTINRKAAETMTPIPPDEIRSQIGRRIHLGWARAGCCWILDQVEGDTLFIRTPKTGRKGTAKVRDAYYTRSNDPTREVEYE